MKAKPGQIKVATAGVTSGGHNAMELISQGHRREVPPRHLRRRQPGGGGHGGRRDRRDHAAGGGAGRHDPRQAHPPAGRGQRQAARARGLRHHRADHASSCPASRRRPTTSASSSPRACPPKWWRRWRRSGPRTSPTARRCKKYATSRGALFAPVAGDAAQAAALPAIQANAWLLHSTRQGQGLARHGRHRQALSVARLSVAIAARAGDSDDDAAVAARRPDLRRASGSCSASRSRSARGAWTGSRTQGINRLHGAGPGARAPGRG